MSIIRAKYKHRCPKLTLRLVWNVNRESESRLYRRPLRRCMRNIILRSANAKFHYILPFFYKMNEGDLPLLHSCVFWREFIDLDPVYMQWGTPVQWGKFLLFCVPQSVKTKETYSTRPGSPTPCKQALSRVFFCCYCVTPVTPFVKTIVLLLSRFICMVKTMVCSMNGLTAVTQ